MTPRRPRPLAGQNANQQHEDHPEETTTAVPSFDDRRKAARAELARASAEADRLDREDEVRRLLGERAEIAALEDEWRHYVPELQRRRNQAEEEMNHLITTAGADVTLGQIVVAWAAYERANDAFWTQRSQIVGQLDQMSPNYNSIGAPQPRLPAGAVRRPEDQRSFLDVLEQAARSAIANGDTTDLDAHRARVTAAREQATTDEAVSAYLDSQEREERAQQVAKREADRQAADEARVAAEARAKSEADSRAKEEARAERIREQAAIIAGTKTQEARAHLVRKLIDDHTNGKGPHIKR